MKEFINTGFHSGSYYYVGYGLPGELGKSYEWFSAKKKKKKKLHGQKYSKKFLYNLRR